MADLDWQALGAAGGFSGAAVWRGDTAGQPALCLKCWPPGTTAQRLEAVHRAMTAAHSTGLVPAVIPSLTGGTAVEHDGRVWDVTGWVPGAADFHSNPTDARLTAACAALADLHRAWAAPAQPRLTPCPGVLRRLALLNDFTSKLPDLASDPYWDRPLALLRPLVPRSIAELTSWANRPVTVHPCLCDIWHDHVFFIGDRVSGIIDYGAVKVDHPAVDLARLLGDLVHGRPDRVRTGLAAYRAAAPLPVEDELVTLLDRTGLICAVIHWRQRLGGTRPGNLQILDRISRLVARLPVV